VPIHVVQTADDVLRDLAADVHLDPADTIWLNMVGGTHLEQPFDAGLGVLFGIVSLRQTSPLSS
jgi:hypothetical protein